MARNKIYPGARQRRYSGVDGIAQPTVSKLVLHSTETPRGLCPGYQSGRAAPTLTVCPWTRQIWQHFDTNESAKALVDPGSTSVRENRDNVAQVEIVGYSDVAVATRYGYARDILRNLDPAGVEFIAQIIAWYHLEWDVPLRTPTAWPIYPASYGNSPARMTGPEYDAYTGVLGHLHVSGNHHGDPALDIAAVMAAARQIVNPPDPDPVGEIMSWYDTKAEFEQTISGIVAHEAPRAPMKSHASLAGGVVTESMAAAIRRDQTIGRQCRAKLTRIEKKLDAVLDVLKDAPDAASGLTPAVFDIAAEVALVEAEDAAQEQAETEVDGDE